MPSPQPSSQPAHAASFNSRTVWPVVIVGLLLAAAVGLVVVALRPAVPASATASGGGASGASRPLGSIDEILNAANSLQRVRKYPEAQALLKQATVEHPEEQRLYFEYAQVLVASQQLEPAYQAYVKALATGQRTAQLELAAGTVASMLNRLPLAEEHLAAAQQADKSDFKAPLFLAQVQLKQDKLEDAKKNLLLAALLKPDSATPWGTLAEIALRENKISIALQHIAKARELEPHVILWRVMHARALKRENKPEQALIELIGLSLSERLEPGVLQTMAECFGMLKRPVDAAKMYSEASDANPGKGDVALQAATWWERAERSDVAVKYAQRAVDAGEQGAAETLARVKK